MPDIGEPGPDPAPVPAQAVPDGPAVAQHHGDGHGQHRQAGQIDQQAVGGRRQRENARDLADEPATGDGKNQAPEPDEQAGVVVERLRRRAQCQHPEPRPAARIDDGEDQLRRGLRQRRHGKRGEAAEGEGRDRRNPEQDADRRRQQLLADAPGLRPLRGPAQARHEAPHRDFDDEPGQQDQHRLPEHRPERRAAGRVPETALQPLAEHAGIEREGQRPGDIPAEGRNAVGYGGERPSLRLRRRRPGAPLRRRQRLDAPDEFRPPGLVAELGRQRLQFRRARPGPGLLRRRPMRPAPEDGKNRQKSERANHPAMLHEAAPADRLNPAWRTPCASRGSPKERGREYP